MGTRLDDLRSAKRDFSRRLLGRMRRARAGWLAASSLRLRDLGRWAIGGVHGIGIGHKLTGGKRLRTLAIRIYVERKLPTSVLSKRVLLPKAIDGLPVDVIERPRASLSAKPAASLAGAGVGELREARRPLVAGVSIGNLDAHAGTLGYFCRRRAVGPGGPILVLSNSHVLCGVPTGSPGDDVYQPGRTDGGDVYDQVADFDREEDSTQPVFDGKTPTPVDAAVAVLVDDPSVSVDLETGIDGIGPVVGVAEAEKDLVVRKVGRTTGLTAGIIDDLDVDQVVDADGSAGNLELALKDQISVLPRSSGPVALGGDSGALFVTESGDVLAVSLLVATPSDGSYALSTPIEAVLDALDVDLIVPD